MVLVNIPRAGMETRPYKIVHEKLFCRGAACRSRLIQSRRRHKIKSLPLEGKVSAKLTDEVLQSLFYRVMHYLNHKLHRHAQGVECLRRQLLAAQKLQKLQTGQAV